MELKDVKFFLNRKVIYTSRYMQCEYILTGCTLRKNKEGNFYYQAELQDIKQNRSVLICGLEDVTAPEKL